MNALTMELTRFMRHDKTKVILPERGVVLVTGPNGAGKSGIVEAVSYGLFGRTLRGTNPWRAGEAGEVRVNAHPVLVSRKVTKGGKVSLAFTKGIGIEPTEYPTLTKAQEALEGIVGSFDIWRRTHVFSSADAAHFTLSTDGERKRLLESILGLEKFDSALDACRADLRAEQGLAQQAEVALLRTRERAIGAVQRLEDARRALGSLPPLQPLVAPAAPATSEPGDDLGRRGSHLLALAVAVKNDLAKLEKAGSGALNEAATARAEAAQLARGLDRLKASECPTCGQAIPDRLRQEYRDDIEAKQRVAEAAEQRAKEEADAAGVQIADLRGELQALEEQQLVLAFKRREQADRERVAQKEREEHARLAQAHEAAKLHVAKCEVQVTEIEAMVKIACDGSFKSLRETAALQAVEAVLGLKGVRAHVLGKALGGCEQVANSWLSRIAGPALRLKLRPYSEKKTGGISDAISLDVEGAGGGLGYKASSGGERRRIDVALLLALAEVAVASHGLSGGPLFFDEVFDALDRDGVAAVAEVLGELARDRAVVVISHSPALAESVPVAFALRVEDGRILAE